MPSFKKKRTTKITISPKRHSDSGRLLIPTTGFPPKKLAGMRTDLPWWANRPHAKTGKPHLRKRRVRWQHDPKKPAITRELVLGSVELINPAEKKLLTRLQQLMSEKIKAVREIKKNKKITQDKLKKLEKAINSINADFAKDITEETNKLQQEYNLVGKKRLIAKKRTGKRKLKSRTHLFEKAKAKAIQKLERKIDNKRKELTQRTAKFERRLESINYQLSEQYKGKDANIVINIRGTSVAIPVNEKNLATLTQKLRPQSQLGTREAKIRHIIARNSTSKTRTLLSLMKRNGITPTKRFLKKIMKEMAKEEIILPRHWMNLQKTSISKLERMRAEMEK